MTALEIFNLTALAILGILSSLSDLKEGLIYNKSLAVFAVYALVADVIMYGFLARDLIITFLINLLVVSVISLILFFSHSFAGGDCKLTIVFALLFPASFYVKFNSGSTTLFFALGLALIFGYFYLLFLSLEAVIKRKVKISGNQIKTTLLNFVKSFFTAMLYICAFNIVVNIFISEYLSVNIWASRIACLAIAFIVNRVTFFKKRYCIIFMIIVNVILSVRFKIIPISLNPENYLIVTALLFCCMTIQSNIYESVSVEKLKKGMILSTASSAMMQNSRVRGLPPISFEDLRSRLTDEEVKSIAGWSKSTGIFEVTTVKKIPFAIFIFAGFFCYFIIWSISV